jgi:hypothetical protein
VEVEALGARGLQIDRYRVRLSMAEGADRTVEWFRREDRERPNGHG